MLQEKHHLENTSRRPNWQKHIIFNVSLALLLFTLLSNNSAYAQTQAVNSPHQTQTHSATTSWLPSTPPNWPVVVDNHTTLPQQQVTSGVSVSGDVLQTVGGPEQVSQLNIDLSNPNVRLGIVQAHDTLFSQDEPISSMANRTHAVAGINADFFNMYGTGDPIGMVEINHRIIQSPSAAAVLGITPSGQPNIAYESFSGTVTDGSASHALSSINRYGDTKGDHLAFFTSDLGSSLTFSGDTVALLKAVNGTNDTYTVQSIQTNSNSLPALSGEDALVGSSSSANWLSSSIHTGDTITISEQISPDNNLTNAVGGGAILVKNGTYFDDPQSVAPSEKNVQNPITALGITKDGNHAFIVVFDGHESGPSKSRGVTQPAMAGYLIAHGAYQAMMFDSGGSSEMVARLPGQQQVSVINTPSDGHERPVANGIFIYSTESAPAPATKAVVNDGRPLTMLTDTTIPLSSYALDAQRNPASTPIKVSVYPPTLASVSNGTITAKSTGHGILIIRSGEAHSLELLNIVDHLTSLAVSPNSADLANKQTLQLQVTGKATNGANVPIPINAVQWNIDPSSMGSIDQTGLFTASDTATALGNVTATIGGSSASSSIAVGQISKNIASLTDVNNWSVTNQYMSNYPRSVPSPGPQTTATGSISLSTTEKHSPDDSGSLDLHYTFTGGQHVLDFNAYPNNLNEIQVPTIGNNQEPTSIGMWIKGNADLAKGSGKPLEPGTITFTLGLFGSDNQTVKFYPAAMTFDGWQFVTAQLPSGQSYPLRFNYLGLVVITPATTMTGDIFVSDFQALYSPRPPKPYVYQPIPANPSWLQYTENPADFRTGGTTIASLDDAHVQSNDPNSTGSVALKQVGQQFKQLPTQAQPQTVQTQGDMVDAGTTQNLQYLKSIMDGFGVPYHEAVGNHEITQGADPETKNYTSVFGATHYSYTAGEANFIVSDSAHIGILASDNFQVPDEEQYQWLINQLNTNTSPVVFITTHVPAYDPHPVKTSQFADSYEAQMYELLAERYQNSHPNVHVVLLFGHARGFSENLLDQYGNDDVHGLPNFVIADVGVPAYAPADQGGFYNYVLFHVLPDGHVQFSVMPLLTKIDVTTPSSAIIEGATLQLTAIGTEPNGNDLAPLQLPISDPASHYWTSSDPRIASIDSNSGKVTAHHPGTVTITCTSDMIHGSTTLTVKP
jgi:Exopolysaccharide biosynthesis protein related to N-acetylglucosamine-1-phosphodiester alpha-N-acetylglucosaminidase